MTDTSIFNLSSIFHQFINLLPGYIPFGARVLSSLVLVVRKIQRIPFDALALVELFLGNGKMEKDSSIFKFVIFLEIF
jgi:hypothetical protein